MAVGFRSSATTAWVNQTDITISKPSGVVDGDLLVAFVSIGGTANLGVTPPAGWSLAHTYANTNDGAFLVTTRIYTKYASSEGANWTWTHIVNYSEGSVLALTGSTAGTPIFPTPTAQIDAPANTTATAPGITTTSDGSLVIFFEQNYANTASAMVVPTGTTPTFTERVDYSTALVTYIATGDMAIAGATGDKTHACNSSSGKQRLGSLVSIVPTAKFADKGTLGSVGNTTANQASLVLTTATTNVAIGDLAVVVIAVDNTGTTDADGSEISGVTSSPANTWVKAKEWRNGRGALQGGATVSMWYTVATAAMNTGSTITATFTTASSADAQGMTARCFTKPQGRVAVEASATLSTGAADPAALDAATRTIECLRIRGIAGEVGNNTSLTPSAGWTAWANGNSATTGTIGEMCARAEHIISVAAGASSNPTWVACDNANVYVAFKPDESLLFKPGYAMAPLIVR